MVGFRNAEGYRSKINKTFVFMLITFVVAEIWAGVEVVVVVVAVVVVVVVISR